jgi:hypothetical protein
MAQRVDRSYFSDYHMLETAVLQDIAGIKKKLFDATSSILVELFNSSAFKEGKVKVFKTYCKSKHSKNIIKLFIECKMNVDNAPCELCNQKRTEMGSTHIRDEHTAKEFMAKHGISIDVDRILSTTCNICLTSRDDDKLLMCSKCDSGFHSYCIDVDMDDVKDKDWVCRSCQQNVVNDTKGTMLALISKVEDMQTSIFKLNKRLYDIEMVNATAKRAHLYIDSKIGTGLKGHCKKCGGGGKIVINHVLFDVMKVERAREMNNRDFISKFVNESKYCKTCKDSMTSICSSPFIDCYSIYSICMICRSRRTSKSNKSCTECKITNFQENHAEFKLPLHMCVDLIQHSVREVRNVTTSYSMDPNAIHKHEYSVGEYGKIDFLVNILDEEERIHMFAIEVMASKVEELTKLPHKMLAAKQKIKPYKTYIICLDIKDGDGCPYTLLEKLDILRRWMIFAIRYHMYLPSINMWWMFPYGRDAYTIHQDYHPLYKNPLKIYHAPAGDVNWEFCTDPYMYNIHTKNPYNLINEKASKFHELFTNNVFIAGDYSRYNRYNIDMGYGSILLCKDNCEICKELLK